ncbi:hypothetical protein B0H11DRAFT_2215091 [Mycena galericulata]|nr:hypothetical protein B0H11DRAFT_2215091 [Mycena galericulata]
MATNACREIVRYMPIWKPDWEDELPALISEDELLKKMIAGAVSVHYDVPIAWSAELALRAAVATRYIPKFWYQPREQVPRRRVDLQRGERHINMDYSLVPWIGSPILAIDYFFVCRRRCPCDCHKKLRAKLYLFMCSFSKSIQGTGLRLTVLGVSGMRDTLPVTPASVYYAGSGYLTSSFTTFWFTLRTERGL